MLVSCTVQKCPSTHKFRLKSQIRKRVLSNYMSKLIANKLSNFMSKLTSNVKFEKKYAKCRKVYKCLSLILKWRICMSNYTSKLTANVIDFINFDNKTFIFVLILLILTVKLRFLHIISINSGIHIIRRNWQLTS